MQIYIHRNNEDFGPYSREAILEYVKQGVFHGYDYACYAGMSEWKPVSELLGIGNSPERAPASRRAGSTPSPVSGQIRTTTSMQQARGSRQGDAPAVAKKRGARIALNMVLVSMVAAGLYLRMGGGGETGRRCLAAISGFFAKPAAPNADDAPAEPEPVAAAPAIAPVAPAAPAPVSTPAPPPKPFDPAAVAGNPGAWPKTLRLKQAVAFPAVFNSRTVGSVTVPAGTAVDLVKIQGDRLILQYQGGTQALSWKLTDLEEEVAKSASVAPATQSAPAAPSATAIPPAPEATAGTVNATPAGN